MTTKLGRRIDGHVPYISSQYGFLPSQLTMSNTFSFIDFNRERGFQYHPIPGGRSTSIWVDIEQYSHKKTVLLQPRLKCTSTRWIIWYLVLKAKVAGWFDTPFLSVVLRIFRIEFFCIRDTRLNSIGWCSQPVTWSGSIIPNLYDKEANCENNRQQFLDWCTRFSPARPGNMVSYMSTDPILKFVPKIFSARWQWNFTNFGSRWHLSLRFYPEIWKKHIFS